MYSRLIYELEPPEHFYLVSFNCDYFDFVSKIIFEFIHVSTDSIHKQS